MKKVLPGNRRKPNWVVGLTILLVLLYIGYVMGLMEMGKKLLDKPWTDRFIYYFLHPFPLIWGSATGKWVLLAGLSAFVVWIEYATRINNRIAGKEYGTARFITAKEITKRLSSKDRPSKILGDGLLLSTDDRKTGLNNNVLVIGGSGSGKSFRIVKPNILHAQGSMIIADPKGELLKDTGSYLEQKGYRIKVLNLADLRKSDGYNPLNYLKEWGDVVKLVSVLMKNTTPAGASVQDPFWERAETLYLQSLIFYVWLTPQMKGRRNLRSVLELMLEAEAGDDKKFKSRLDKRMEELGKAPWIFTDTMTGKQTQFPGNKHPAVVAYALMKQAAGETLSGILISAGSRLGFLVNSPELLNALDEDEFNIPALGLGYGDEKQKTALFCIIPDADTSLNAVAGILYSQVFEELYRQADKTKTGRLPISVECWFDEFTNIAMPKDFLMLLATMRSRGISANIIIQNIAQIKGRYKDDWETIPGNCDTIVYLGGNEQSTHKYVSEMLGKYTAEKRSFSSSKGRNGSSSHSDDVMGRELLTPDEVRMLPNKKEVVLIRGQYPVLCDKYNTLKDTRFQEAVKLGSYEPEEKVREQKARLYVLQGSDKSEEKDPLQGAVYTSLQQLRKLDRLGKPFQLEYVLADNDENAGEKPGETTEQTAMTAAPSSTEADRNDNDSIRTRMAKYEYTDAQFQEAILASADGLTEAQILEWFFPENSAKKMELMRKMQLQMQKIGQREVAQEHL